jgi:Fe-S cluster assembly iron-binding protein IscA
MVLDEPRNGDKVIDHSGITFVVEQEFFDRIKPIAVDFNSSLQSSSFSISSAAYNFSLRVLL